MNKRFRLRIEKFALGGFGIGYSDSKAVFVPYTAPGDDIEAVLLHARKDVAFARAESFYERGDGVLATNCEAFAAPIPCGGCDWLHLDYRRQLEIKTSLIRELLQPLDPACEIHDIAPAPQTKEYRNKAFLPVGIAGDKLFCGIYSRWSHQIVKHRRCLLHPPIFDEVASTCLDLLSKAKATAYNELSHSGSIRHLGFRINRDHSQLLLIIVTRSAKLPFSNLLVKQLTESFPQITGIVQNINRERGNVILGAEEKILFGVPWITDELGGVRFRVHYRSFWQVNSATAAEIVARLKSLTAETEALVDVFSGIGALGLSLSAQVKEVLCIEDNPAAIADGEHNAAMNGIVNAGFLRARAEDALPTLFAGSKAEFRPSCLILDPPRGGVQAQALQAIIGARVPRVLYLSCSPMTLKRDLQMFLASGIYKLRSIQPFDMFPQTWHIESLAILDLT